MSEIALISARKNRLESSAKKGIKVQNCFGISKFANKFLSTVQIGITLIGILTGI
jgi:putative hemolysin